jgi:hypothetical protein
MAFVDLTNFIFLFEEPLETLWVQRQTGNSFSGVLKVPSIIDGEHDSLVLHVRGTVNSVVQSPAGRDSFSITMLADTRTYMGAALSVDGTDRHLLFAGTYSYSMAPPTASNPDLYLSIGPIPFAGVGRPKR